MSCVRWLFISVLFSGSVFAAEVFLKPVAPSPATQESSASVTFTPAGGGEGRNVRVTTGRPVSVPLPKGLWHVHTTAPDYFAVDAVVRIERDDDRVTVPLWRTAAVRGKLVVGKTSTVPNTLLARWSASDSGSEAETPPEGAFQCTVQKDAFACDVPVGNMDLRLRAPGYITHFRWNVKIKADGVDLGELALKRGSSIVGRVTLPRRPDVSRITRVFIRPVTYDAAHKREALLSVPVRPDNGFFEFAGIAPGDYLIGAMQGNLRSREVPVSVRGTSESEMNAPLVLEPPRTLRIAIDPRTDPEGKPWKVSLSTFRTERSLDSPREAFAEADGVSTWKDLLPARYMLSVGSHIRGTVLSKTIDLQEAVTELSVTIPSTSVRGTVRLGDKPISGVLTVGGRSAPVSVPLDVAEDGTFAGTVPFDPKAEWKVAFDSTSPPIQMTKSVRPQELPENEGWRLDVALDGWGIDGTVIDANGKPVEKAIVDISGTDAQQPIMQAHSGGDGSFSITGLPSGGYSVAAKSFRHESSDPVTVHVGEDDPPARLKLVVTPDDEIKGQILSAGGPIGGAQVFALPTDKSWISSVPGMSAPDGSFRVPLPANTHEIDLVVSPPGFPLKMLHMHMRHEPLTVTVEQNAGALDLDVPELSDRIDTPQGVLVHRGAVQAVISFLGSREAVISPGTAAGTTKVLVPMMEPGDYALCAVRLQDANALHGVLPQQNCVFGTLAPFATLHLVATNEKP